MTKSNVAGSSSSLQPNNPSCFLDKFEERIIPRVWLGDQWLWPAKEVGRTIEHEDDGKRFVRNVTDGELVDGIDYLRVTGDILASVSSVIFDGANSAPSKGKGGVRREMILLSESGLNLSLMRSRTEIGKRMRLWLAREVLPSLRRTGTYTIPSATVANDNDPTNVDAIARRVVEMLQGKIQPDLSVLDEISSLKEMVQEMRSLQPVAGTLTGKMQAGMIRGTIRELAQTLHEIDRTRTVKGFQTQIHQMINPVVNMGGSGSTWELATVEQFFRAMKMLKSLMTLARRLNRRKPNEQLVLAKAN